MIAIFSGTTVISPNPSTPDPVAQCPLIVS